MHLCLTRLGEIKALLFCLVLALDLFLLLSIFDLIHVVLLNTLDLFLLQTAESVLEFKFNK